MTVRDLLVEGIEQSINLLIQQDPKTQTRFARLHGSCVGIYLRGTGIKLYFIPDHSGALQVASRREVTPDAAIEGSPVDLLRASDKQNSTSQLFAGHVQLHGDTALAQRFSQALADLSIDWEEHLSKWLGDTVAYAIAQRAKKAAGTAGKLSSLGKANLSEYLTEELRVLPHHFEVEAFVSDLEKTRDDVERLSARINLLVKGLAK